MTNSESTIMAILLGLGVFAIIAAIGWRSVQNRRILRMQGADGKETIIVAREDDEISSVVTTSVTSRTEPAPAAAPDSSVPIEDAGAAELAPTPPAEFGRKAVRGETAVEGDSDDIGRDHGGRADSSTE